MNLIDHVTIGASDLILGVQFVRQRLDVEMAMGGKHPDMSTHNYITRTGPGQFLEMIAIDPQASPIGHARWFGLDDPDQQRRIAAQPAPVAWVVRTTALDAIADQSKVALGAIKKMTRGARSWRLTLPESGRTAFSGVAPHFIEWEGDSHPSDGMADCGLKLDGIVLRHPDPQALSEWLRATSADHLATVVRASEPGLSFTFRKPGGELCEIA